LPHVIYESKGKRGYIEKSIPYRMSLGIILENNSKFTIRPLRDGYLAEMENNINNNADKDKRKIGFGFN
jgi:hypothetical protein